MLWYKGWLETRWRFVFSLGIMVFFVVSFYWAGVKHPPPGRIGDVLGGSVVSIMWVAGMLAGSGINTQPGLQATKGLHGSTYFTLSLPVSRLRLLLVRSGLGWLLLTGITIAFCCGFWSVFPPLRAAASGMEMIEYAGLLVAFGSAFYSTSVFLGTFLDDLWRMWGTFIAWFGSWALGNILPVPPSASLFQAVLVNSPLAVHAMPWTALALAMGLTLVSFWAALRVVRVREY